MQVAVSGGTGFIGSGLIPYLITNGCRVTTIARSRTSPFPTHPHLDYISADTTRVGPWQEAVAKADVVINLAGVSIFKRWSAAYKKTILDSRILTTRHIVAAMDRQHRPVTLISTSAAGFYGDRGDDVLTETEPPAHDFLARVCVDWENEARVAEAKGVRVVIARFGVILGPKGGALQQMLPLFRWGLGGPVGKGRHWFPWIHQNDLYAALWFAMENPAVRGAYNYCAPEPVRNRRFAETLSKVLRRPAFFTTPGFMLSLIFGEFGRALQFSQRTIPLRLQNQGYRFAFPILETALQNLVR
jgi:uncharacterized protein